MLTSENVQNDKFTKLIRIINGSDFPKIVKSAVREYVKSSGEVKDDERQSALGEDQWFGFTDDLKFGIFDFDFEKEQITYQHLLMPVAVSEIFGFRIQKGTPVKIKEIVKKYCKLVDEINSSFLELGDNGLAFVNGLCPLENVIYSPQAREDAVESHYQIAVWNLDDAQTFIKYIDENWSNLAQPEKDVRIFMTLMLRQRNQFNLVDYQELTDKFTADELLTFYNRFNIVVDSSVNDQVIHCLFTKEKVKELLTERANDKALVKDDLELFGLGNFFDEWSTGSGQELPKIKMVLDKNCDIGKINHQLKNVGGLTSSIRSNLFTIEIAIADDDDTLLTLLDNQNNIGRFFEKIQDFTKKLKLMISEGTVSKLQQMQDKFETDCQRWFTKTGKERFEKIMNPNLIVLNRFLEQNKELVEVTSSEDVDELAEKIKAGSEENKEMPAKFIVE